MTHPLSGLEPKLLWDHFAAFAAIPRGSKNEAAASAHVVAVAARLGLPSKVDSVGNVVITKPGTKGLESRPVVVLQGHVDMVCEKNSGTAHDFTKDPIRLIVDGEVVKADGTTLGADNGIGCAAALAILESNDLAHPPLECLFTIDEETGMTGRTSSRPASSPAAGCSTSTPRRRGRSTSAAPAESTPSPRRRSHGRSRPPPSPVPDLGHRAPRAGTPAATSTRGA
jgi:Di- and tripeptidases